ncbi:phosphodiesterase [Frigidibacter sp. MR17.24]|uniref:phosphodiesterase n=1 Tax=Frigidibacter sp. MR17.24 TaxID=3127345 RepID=UPI003012B4E2
MKIIQITDTHLVPSGRTAHGIDPERQLRGAIADITARHADADLVVITGDLCNDGEPEAYALLREILRPVTAPVRLLLGNHDHRPNFRAAFPDHPCDAAGYVQSAIDTAQGRLIFLDTHEKGVVGGIFGADRMAFLADALAGAGDQPVTVFVHHPPLPDGIRHFRDIGLHDNGRMRAALAAHAPGVRQVVFGHIHVPMTGMTPDGLAYSSGQACAHRFVTDVDAATPDWTGGNPCYRVIHIDALGFRAYMAEAGQAATAPSQYCAGP